MLKFSTPVFLPQQPMRENNSWWRRLGSTFCFCLGLTAIASAQTKIWDKYLDSGTNSKTIALPTTDGGYILGGSSASGISKDKSQPSRGGSDYWIVKLDANRNKVWDKTLGGADGEQLIALQLTQDGGYILGGTSGSGKSGDKTQASKGKLDYWVVKINANGAKVWDKTLGGLENDQLSALQQTSDGGFILGGTSLSGKSGDKTLESRGKEDYWVVKLNVSGNTVWDRTFGGTDKDYLTSLQQTHDGGYVLGGVSYSGIGVEKSEASRGRSDYWVVKLKSDGSKVWDKTIGGAYSDGLVVVRQTGDKGYILGGTSDSYISGDKTAPFLGVYDTWDDGDYWLVKLDEKGQKVWDKTQGGSDTDELTALEPTQDGGFILGGAKSYSAYGEVMKLTAQGEKVWRTLLYQEDDNLKLVTSIIQTSDGSYLAGGKDTFKEGLYLIKYAQDKAQTITFKPISTVLYGTAAFSIEAKASSGLPLDLYVESGPAEISGNTLTPTGVGTVTIKAYQYGNKTYAPVEAKYTFEIVYPSKITTSKVIGGSAEDKLAVMQKTRDGGYILGGSSRSGISDDKTQANKGELDFWVVKLKVNGSIQWSKTLGGSKSDQLKALQQTTDGGYILGGTTSSGAGGDKSQAGKGQADYWVIKLNADGSKAWDKTLGGTSADSLSALQQTRDDGYILGGYSYSNKSTDKTGDSKGSSDYWVVKLNASGTKEWDKTYGGSNVEILTSLQQTKDNGYILGGASASNISGDKSQPSRGGLDYWVVKLKADGSKEWDKTTGGDKKDYLTVVLQTSDEGYMVGGYSNSSDNGHERGDKWQPSKGKMDYWIVKMNTYQGEIDWNSTYGGKEDDYLTSIQELKDQTYLLGGYSASGISGDKTEANRGTLNGAGKLTTDYWVVKVEKKEGIAGTSKMWDKTIGGNGQDELVALLPTAGGSYALGGSSNSGISGDKTPASKGGLDYWIVDLNIDEMPTVPYWNWRYGGFLSDYFTTLIRTTDGGYLAGGYINSYNSGEVDFPDNYHELKKLNYWVIKTDRNGKKEWAKLYGGSQDDYLNHVIQTQDGGYLLAGSTFSGKSSNKSQDSRGGRDYWIVKIDKLGNKQWDKRYGGTGDDELKKVIQLASGRYILVGSSNSPQSGDKSQGGKGDKDYWILKINPDGQKVWDRSYGGSLEDLAEDVAVLPDGGLLLGGSSKSSSSGDRTQGSRGASDYWVLRLDGNGRKVWDRRYGGAQEDQLMAVGTTPAGNLYLAGTSTSKNSGDKSQIGPGGSDYWLLEINNNGSKLWDKTYGGSQDEELRSVLVTADKGYLLAGSSSSGVSGDKTQESQGASDYWVVKTDQAGKVQWDQRKGGSGKDKLRAMVLAQDGGIVLGGRSDSNASGDRSQWSYGKTDFWLIKIAPENSRTLVRRVVNEPELTVDQIDQVQVLVYPNPFSERVTLSFTLPETQAATVRVLDSQGREVTTLFQAEARANQKYEVEWQAGKQEAGMYLLQLHTPTGQNTQKVILRK